MGKRRKIFVSAAHSDQPFVTRLIGALQRAGWSTFDPDSVDAGDHFFSRIRRELESSELVVFVVPPREGEGKWALAEIGAAKALNKRIVAVVPERSRYSNTSVARLLSESSLVDASDVSDDELAQTIVSSVVAH